jgi:hypothetical protein
MHPNTATFTTNTTGTTGAASQSVQVCVGKDLTVSKTATPSYTYGITKTANQGSIKTSNTQNTLGYTVTVTESGWQVSGTITVTNPNDERLGICFGQSGGCVERERRHLLHLWREPAVRSNERFDFTVIHLRLQLSAIR